jgi:hypothetical protein
LLVKACPKCGVENAPTYSVCRRCQTALGAVIPAESAQEHSADPFDSHACAVAPPSPSGPAAILPLGQAGPKTGRPNPGPYGEYPPQRRTAPPLVEVPQSGVNPVVRTILTAFVLGAILLGGFIVWRKANAPKPKPAIPADKVVVAFLQAKSTGKIEFVMPYLSKESTEMLRKALGGRQAESAGITRQDVADIFLWGQQPSSMLLQGATISAAVVDDPSIEKDSARVRASVVSTVKFLGPMKNDFDYILVNEESLWKVDLAKSQRLNSGGIMKLLGH